MKRWSRWCLLLGSLLLLLGIAGCQKKEEILPEGVTTYQIYYLNPGMTRLVTQDYHTLTTDAGELVEELMQQLRKVPDALDAQVPLSEKVVYQGYKQEQQVLYLLFDGNYTSMKRDREILCRAALAKTMTQIDGVDYISIYSADQPLLNSAGRPVGMISAGDFADSISDVNAYEETELTLYFTDETGELLYPEQRSVVHNINTSVEKVILEELIRGPETEGLFATLDSGMKLLNVSVTENVCYLNFDSSFLNHALEVRDYIPIYSIVNSLSELSKVSKVQITVNGVQDVSFRDTISLNTLFERNLDYIGGTES